MRHLRLQLEQLERSARRDPQPFRGQAWGWQGSQGEPETARVNARQVENWGEFLADQAGWSVLRRRD